MKNTRNDDVIHGAAGTLVTSDEYLAATPHFAADANTPDRLAACPELRVAMLFPISLKHDATALL
jgi:hypothetical protein